MKPLHQIIKEHRRLSGLSQSQLAKLAGVGKTAVFDLEHGKQSIRFDTLTKILTVLNITIRYDSPLMSRLQAMDSNEASDAAEV